MPHAARWSYLSFVAGETGAPIKVQQELMRPASIQMTVNVYGHAISSSKREANGKFVKMMFKAKKASANQAFSYKKNLRISRRRRISFLGCEDWV